ncbi:hypothetical protein L7F22_041989 [Adiantum nelumboides]|nr:hypothetical protein [Adiantum nelumboides]
MRIHIKTLTGKSLEMKGECGETVLALKMRIEAKEGTPCHRQRLIHAGRLLDDTHTLADYHIHKGSVIFLCPQGAPTQKESWWRSYALCINEIQYRSVYHNNFEDGLLQKYFEDMETSNMSFNQQIALQGLKAQVLTVTTKVRKAAYIQELDVGLAEAIKAYEGACASGMDSGPFIIHPDVPYLIFENWYKCQENTWRIAFQFLNSESGIALLYGDPSFLHEGISQWFGQSLADQVAILVQATSTSLVSVMGSAQVRLPGGSNKEPDFCVQPRRSPHRIPPFVGEVAYANESLEVLKAELVQWTVDGAARIAYGVKVSRRTAARVPRKATDISLRFLERIQGENSFSRDLDFSPDACTRRGDSKFLIEFPLREIFTGVTNDERLLTANVTFDLFALQELILELQENHAVDFAWHPKDEAKGDGSPLLKGCKHPSVHKKQRRLTKRIGKWLGM